ncbi:MAG: division/cell wall cluster transcriptional repressor MraZ [Deltaproteobacteria bacterium]|nr:division/cell wall cluster transcriptional repressor MraZ [Deltaproteobacteria bacterium]
MLLLDKHYFFPYGGYKWGEVGEMFRGRYEHTIDEKGRVNIPIKFKKEIPRSSTVVLTFFDRCLYCYPLEQWKKIEDKASNLPITSQPARRFKRIFFSAAIDVQVDSHRRILIPPLLRNDAGIEKEAVFIGNLDHVELWAKERWYEEIKELRKNEEKIMEELSKLGIF